MSNALQISERPCSLRHRMTFSKWMKSGASCGKKEDPRWLWTALWRRTRQMVAVAIGDRSKATCFRLWKSIPEEYKHCHTLSDFWAASKQVFPAEIHCCVGKENWRDSTSHIERWNNTLCQRVGRNVRQTLSFSKSDEYHEIVTSGFFFSTT